MNENNERKTGAILSYLSIIISTIVQLIYTPFLIKCLGQSEYGLYSLISSIIGYLTVLDLGFGNAIIVYTSKYHAQKKYVEEKRLHGMFKVIFNIIGAIAALLGLILYFNVESLFGSTMTAAEISKAKIMMLILSINIFISFSFSIYSSIISAYERFNFQKILSIVSIIMRPICMIPLLLLGYKSIMMVVVITVINILVLASNYIYCRKKLNINVNFNGFDRKLFKTIFAYSFFIFLGVIGDKVNWSLDQFILGSVSGTVAVSVYSVASQFVMLYMNLSSSCCSIMLPKLSKMVARQANDSELNEEFIKFGRIQWYLMLLILCGFAIYGYEFIRIWAGDSYITAYYIVLILIAPLSLVLAQNVGVFIMQAKNLHKTKTILTFMTSIFNVLISVPLAKRFAGIGSALGTSFSLIICNLIMINIYYYKKVGLNVMQFWKNIFRITIPTLPVIIIAAYINNIFRATSLISIIECAIIFSLFYFLLIYFFSFDEYEKNLLLTFINRFKKVFKKS